MDAWLSRRAVLGGAMGSGLLAVIGTSPVNALTNATDPVGGVPGVGRPDPGRPGAGRPGAARPGGRPGADGPGVGEPGAGRLAEGLPLGDTRAEFALAVTQMVHSRRAWRARPPNSPVNVLDLRPDHIVVHHTATPNTKDLSLDHAYELSRQIQQFHMAGRGWGDMGEQFTISRGGHIMEGRARSLPAILSGRHVVGAHVLDHNLRTIGIESEGTYSTVKVPAQLWSSLVWICTALCRAYKLDPFQAILGHRDFNRTACPGDVLYDRLPELRRTVAARLDPPRPRPRPRRRAAAGSRTPRPG